MNVGPFQSPLLALRKVQVINWREPNSTSASPAILVTSISAPPIWFVLFMLALSVVWYSLFLLLGNLAMGAALNSNTATAIGVLAVNATSRGCLKYRERAAMQAEWKRPVGRQRQIVLVFAIAFGFLCGGLAAYALWLGIAALRNAAPTILLILVGATWEAWQNGRKIGGGSVWEQLAPVANRSIYPVHLLPVHLRERLMRECEDRV